MKRETLLPSTCVAFVRFFLQSQRGELLWLCVLRGNWHTGKNVVKLLVEHRSNCVQSKLPGHKSSSGRIMNTGPCTSALILVAAVETVKTMCRFEKL